MDLTEDTAAPYRATYVASPPEPDFAAAAHAQAQQAAPWLIAFTTVQQTPAYVHYRGRLLAATSYYIVQVWDLRTAGPHSALGAIYLQVTAPTAEACLRQLAERFAEAATAELLAYATSLANCPQL